jgi:hypothetical protein
MIGFWDLPFSVCIDAPDEELGSLERLAQTAAPHGWGLELDSSNTMHFRFAKEEEAVGFLLGCSYPSKG